MLRKILFTTFISALAISKLFAAEITHSAAVNKFTCDTKANTTQPFILVLNSGDNLIESISQCAKSAKLLGASISGLGQVQNPTLAYFSSNPNDKPTLTTFPGFYELASLSGNIAKNNDTYFTHAHGVIADKKFHGIAGHINAAKVGMTVEVTIIPFTETLQRSVDKKTGFGPIIH